MNARSDQLRCTDFDTAAFVTYQSVRATMLASLLERTPMLDQEALISQLVDLVTRYLVRDKIDPS